MAYIDFEIEMVYTTYKESKGDRAMAGNKFQTQDVMARCVPMTSVQAVLGGKWKILIL